MLKSNPIAALLCTFAVAVRLTASPTLTPPDLQPGDTYRLIFVTDATRDATSSNIADYNAFVTAEAAGSPALAALRTNWRALAATEFTSVFDNTGLSPADTTTRFYNTRGELIAIGSLYAGTHLAAIFNAAGNPISTPVWTGSTTGEIHFFALGIRSGISGYSNDLGAWSAGDTRNVSVSLALYGLSDSLTVPAAATETPEPSSFFSGATAALVAVWARRRRAA